MDQEVAELVEFNHAIAVFVELFNQGIDVSPIYTDLKLDKHCHQFICCQYSVFVGIKFPKDVFED